MGRSMRPRVYSETAPYEQVTTPRVLRALAQREIEIVLAVRPWNLPALADTARAIEDAGVALALWPMLADEDGRFLHVGNVARMRDLVERALEACAGRNVRDVMLDVEPPVAALRALRKGSVVPALRSARAGIRLFRSATQAVASLREHIVSAGASATAAVAPHVLFERDTGLAASRALGTVGIGEFTYVDVMAYTTLFEGYSLGLVGRRGAHHMLRHVAMRAKARPGTRVALGCIGTGAIGDEQVYASPANLAEDVAIARAAGAQSLALLDLGGILARPPIDSWLDAFALPAS